METDVRRAPALGWRTLVTITTGTGFTRRRRREMRLAVARRG